MNEHGRQLYKKHFHSTGGNICLWKTLSTGENIQHRMKISFGGGEGFVKQADNTEVVPSGQTTVKAGVIKTSA